MGSPLINCAADTVGLPLPLGLWETFTFAFYASSTDTAQILQNAASDQDLHCLLTGVSVPGLPRSEKNIWKINFFSGQGKVQEFCGWAGKFKKDLESQGKVREFENK